MLTCSTFQGVKKVRDLIQNKDSTLSKENQRFNQLEIEWRSIFRKLDARDGLRDGVIKKQSFLNWVLAMDADSALNICSQKELTKYIHHIPPHVVFSPVPGD